jgi:hypothetical protein
MAQLPRAAREVPQVLVWEKSPLTAMLIIVSAVVLLPFRKVSVAAAPVLPTTTSPKERDVLERVTVCACIGSSEATNNKNK